MSPYDWMKLAAALRLLLRTGRRGVRHPTKPPMSLERNTLANTPPSATDLLGWHPRIQREPDPRQPSLPL